MYISKVIHVRESLNVCNALYSLYAEKLPNICFVLFNANYNTCISSMVLASSSNTTNYLFAPLRIRTGALNV